MGNCNDYEIANLDSYKQTYKRNGKPILRSRNWKTSTFSVENVNTSDNIDLLKCRLCKGIPREPVKLRHCGHLFCFRCVYQLFECSRFCASHHVCAPIFCPFCNERYSQPDILKLSEKDPELYKTFIGLKVTCANGCGKVADPVNMHHHEHYLCERRPVLCPFEECEQVLQASELDDHIDSCEYKQGYCEWCNRVKRFDDETHISWCVHVDWIKDKNGAPEMQFNFW